MKIATIFFIILTALIRYGHSFEVNPEDYYKTPQQELDELIALMDGMGEKLRGDRIDETVHIDGKDIDDRLDKLIKEVEGSYIIKKGTARQKQLMWLAGNNPAKKSELRPGSVISRTSPLSPYTSERDSWASLPPDKRDQIVQTYSEDVPLRWRKRLEAYYVSLAAEEQAYESTKKRTPEPGVYKSSAPRTENREEVINDKPANEPNGTFVDPDVPRVDSGTGTEGNPPVIDDSGPDIPL